MSADRYAIEYMDKQGRIYYHIYRTKNTRDKAAERLENRGNVILGKYYLERPSERSS